MRLLLIGAVLATTGCASPPSYVAAPASQSMSLERPNHRHAWMNVSAKKLDLLYISEADGEVTVYTYWQRTLVGELTDFYQPQGECVDKAGNVYVTDSFERRIVEYAHAGTKPLRTIDDSPYAPYGCSVAASTGDLAVANEAGGASKGNIAIYPGASGTPTYYTDKNIPNFRDCAYNSGGDLLASNDQQGSDVSSFAWFPTGGGRLINVTLPGPSPSWTWKDVTGIQWDGKYWVIDDYQPYRVSVIDGQGYYIGFTPIEASGGTAGPFWIYNDDPTEQGTQVVGVFSEPSRDYVYYWDYPSGGAPIAEIGKDISLQPVALTVSLSAKP